VCPRPSPLQGLSQQKYHASPCQVCGSSTRMDMSLCCQDQSNLLRHQNGHEFVLPGPCEDAATASDNDFPLLARLRDLKVCLHEGLLTEAVYEELRQRLFNSFASFSHTPIPQDIRMCFRGAAEDHAMVDDSPRHPVEESQIEELCCEGDQMRDVNAGFVIDPLESKSSLTVVDGIVEECKFWCSELDRQERSPPHRQMSPVKERRLNQITMSKLQMYDITSARLHDLFRRFDTDRDQRISLDELAAGLANLNLLVGKEGAQRIIKHLRKDDPTSKGIDFILFEQMISRLRLAELFTPGAGVFQFHSDGNEDRSKCPITICDYSAQICNIKKYTLGAGEPNDEAIRFFWGSLEFEVAEDSVMQWVHVDAAEGLDRLTLLRLAMKYHLHPLAIDDVIDNRTPTKIDRFSALQTTSSACLQQIDHSDFSQAGYLFVSANILSLAFPSKQHPPGDRPPPPRVRLRRSSVSIFLVTRERRVLTIFQDRPDRSSWLAMWRGEDTDVDSNVDQRLWTKLFMDLEQEPPRRIREQTVDFFVYEILDRISDQFRPIAEAYAERLGYMHQQPLQKFTQAWQDELDEVQLELVDISRSIKPMMQVVRHLIHDVSFSATAKLYLEDVKDSLELTLEDVAQLREMGRTLEEAYVGFREQTTNSTLFVLSVISAIFLPAQFFTGLYGMNFEDANGDTQLPELKMKNGYLYFWIMQICIVVVTSACFTWFSKRIGCRCFCHMCNCPHRKHRVASGSAMSF